MHHLVQVKNIRCPRLHHNFEPKKQHQLFLLMSSSDIATKKGKTFTWDEIEKHNHEGSAWLVIHGKVYDVTKFVPYHPGGDMILLAAGRQSTELFLSHHPTKTITNQALLDKYYIGEVEQEKVVTEEMIKKQQTKHIYAPEKQTKFYEEVRSEVEKYFKDNNLTPRDVPEMYVKTILSLSIWFVLYLATFYYFDSIIVSFFVAIVWGWANANIGMGMMHDANHGGYSDNPTINRIVGLCFDVLGGSSYTWKMIHSVGHHVHTNVEERDPDIHTNEPHFRKIKAGQKQHWWYKYQHIYLPFLYCTLLFELAFRDFFAMVLGAWGGVKFQPAPKNEYLLFVSSKMCWITYSLIIPVFFSGHTFQRVLLLWTIAYMVASFILVLNFQVNHVTPIADTYHVEKDGMVHADWAETQVTGSSNFAPRSWLWNHISGGLCHQTEHHLFPTICHVHYPKIQPIVERVAKKYGIRYNAYPSFWDAVVGHFTLLKEMGQQGKKVTGWKQL
ncbi:hypothetical protein C9374_010702 [Naegleria lovaniensis]|uniref:Cytochrome b5 heme-binding domain-containing protein n=1 Tax=Naegleria lovaniensis TaxID=51637 RepID=A0AA88KDT6_NAELO|nr:uncharacterized protein C9374_010702 [Naegleria lovaniensis]KAG2374418.1 hypothetical protein C9374_010702 [Naegleria lovaniensis]